MEEIDTFIKRLKDEQEMKDYLEQNIYPPSLKSTIRPIIYHTPLDEIKSKPIKCINITDDLQFTSNLFNKLNTLERQIKDSIDLENKENVVVNENDCPICFENIGDSNYLVPSCGHKVCISCFTNNIKYNKSNANSCCLCRQNILPDI